MPELPEVETIRIGLQKYLVGHVIEDIDVRLKKMVEGDVQDARGAKVRGVRRFGKGLVIDLDNSYSIAIHVKMTGQLIYRGSELPKETHSASQGSSNEGSGQAKMSEKVGGPLPNRTTHVIFHLDKGTILYYNDIRQFGWIKVVETEKIEELPFFKELGPEPFKELTLPVFRDILKRTKASIKPVLMDQKRMSGIGNIYANDALFLAKIHPQRPAQSLTSDETKLLFDAIETVLKKGLAVGGASEWQYVNALGQTGSYQNFFQVYGRVGKPCLVCGTKITKIVVAGRGTFYCTVCQI